MDQMQNRITSVLLISLLLFAGLGARLAYLGGSSLQAAAAAGIEMEVFHQYPLSEEAVQVINGPHPAPKVRAPNLAGLTYEEAGQAAQVLGLLLEARGDLGGRVLRQEPPPGAMIPRGARVEVWLGR